jgi:hypothetical protein
LEIILSQTNKKQELVQREVTTSHKTLGTHKCIVGKESANFQHLEEKSNKIALLTIRSQMNRRQSAIAYQSCYIPAMTYSLLAVSLNEQDLTKIQQRATTVFTRKYGFAGTFPKAVVHGLIAFGGLGFHHLYVESNILKIETILCNIK